MADSSTEQKNKDLTTSESAVDVGVESDDISSKALLLEESTSLGDAPPHIRELVHSLGPDPDLVDVTTALAVVVLVQSGFRIKQDDAKTGACTYDARVIRALRSLPPGWLQKDRPGRYELPLWLSGRPDAECRLVGFLSQETLLVTLLVIPDTSFSMALTVKDPWSNLSAICQRTYQMAAEVRSHLLHNFPQIHPALMGIPDDIVRNILAYLDARDLCRLSCVCRSLNEATNIQSLWRRLLHLRFGVERDPMDGDYKKAYAKEEEKVRKCRYFSRPRVISSVWTRDRSPGHLSRCFRTYRKQLDRF